MYHPRSARIIFLTATLLCLFCRDTYAGAFAFASLDIKFGFALASDQQSVEPGPPVTFCFGFGSGFCGPSGVEASFGLGETFGPTPIGEELTFELIDNVFAESPPPDLSFYRSAVTGFFDFHNYSDNPVDIELRWAANYTLEAFGNRSRASLDGVAYREKDVATGDILIPNTLLFGPDEQSNDGFKDVSLSGLIVVSILAHSTTSLRIEDPIEAEAETVVPEPSTLVLCVTIAAPGSFLWLYRRRRTLASRAS